VRVPVVTLPAVAVLVAALLPGSPEARAAPAAPTAPATQTMSAPPPALVGVAVGAVEARDWCRALAAFLALDARWPSPYAVYNAAEVAYAASDRARALDQYRLAQTRYPDHERKTTIRRRVDEVFATMVREGPGMSCPLPPSCGDWFLQQGERCDDGNAIDGDGCDHDCSVTACGNGVVTVGEQCDDGNAIDGDGCDHDCSVTACGNGVRTAGEQCDDGNDRDGDGCDHGCVVTACGNGIVTAGERCDDGNDTDGDGCERTCAITRRPAPALGTGVASAGGAAALGGVALVGLGVQSWLRLSAAVDAVDESRAGYRVDPGQALEDVDGRRDELDQASAAWGSGATALVAGAVLALGGGGALAGGVWLALTQTEEVVP